MAIGCGPKCSKLLLIVFNIFFWLTGLALIVLSSIYLLGGNFKNIDEITEPKSRALTTLLYVILILGIIVFVIGFCGCCGALRESKMLLGIYIVLLLIIMVAEIACGIYAVVKKNKISDEIADSMLKNINTKYRNGTEFHDFTKAVDSIQIDFKCCGLHGFADWRNTMWYKERQELFMECPQSCCKEPNDAEKRSCYNAEEYYKEGCFEKLKYNMSKNFPILIGILIGIALFEIFVVIFACCLCQNTGTLAHSAI